MDEKMKQIIDSTQNYGSTGIAVLLAMLGLGDVPFQFIDKTVGWYMAASREELIKASVLIFAAIVCWAYKNPKLVKEAVTGKVAENANAPDSVPPAN